MDFHHYIGIDIAKATLDWAVYSEQGNHLYFQTPNSVAGIKLGLRNLKALANWQPAKAVFCMEHTAGTVVKNKYQVRIFSISLNQPKDNSTMMD